MGAKGYKRDAAVLQADAAQMPWVEVKELTRPSGKSPPFTLESRSSGPSGPSRGAELEVGESPPALEAAVVHRTGRRTT